ncbi:MAG: polymerase III, alpha subunit protein [Candidatus Curtissbacteria bacterium GW2011_GWA2_41_24]|nr:MAG: polymerase III, alpha subunit protein [Candidatus Curtissbacteria bacterium GW2011_GWA2_41_24]
MYDIEETGLVKMDFLGIRNLSILGNAVEIVEKTKKIKIDLDKIDLDNNKAFDLLAKGETMGLFQLGGSGMTRYLKELKPTSIFDIMAMISLFRPGPMNSIPEFIERKNNPNKIKFFDTRMADYLKESYGVIVYQDDVLLTAINIAGYSWEEADKFRKAMGKKIPSEMTKQREKFIDGCIKNGMSGEKAEDLFKLIEPFAAYGFNKAHAASYALIAYQTAFMKANYPVEFMAAVMSAETDDPDKIAAAVNECAKMGIVVLPPDINFSDVGFIIQKIPQKLKSASKQGIRFGLSAIKNVGKAAIEVILTERNQKGVFKSLDDFVRRVNLRVVNRKTLESLIKAGAMDTFGKRNAMLKVLDEIRSSGTSLSKTIATGQGSLFDQTELTKQAAVPFSINSILTATEEAPKEEILSWERELLGFYLTEHPIAKVSAKLAQVTTAKIADLDFSASDHEVRLGGIVSSIRKTFTRARREEMCFLKLQDESGSIEIIVFPRVYEASKHLLLPDQIVVIWGRLEINEDTPILIAEKISSLDSALQTETEEEILEVTLPQDADRILLSKIYQVLKSNPGDVPTYLVLPSENGMVKKFPVPMRSRKTSALQKELEILGCRIISL